MGTDPDVRDRTDDDGNPIEVAPDIGFICEVCEKQMPSTYRSDENEDVCIECA